MKKIRDIIEKIIFIIACIVFVYSSYQLISYYIKMGQVKQEFVAVEEEAFTTEQVKKEELSVPKKKKKKTFNYTALKKKNEDCIGWITIKNTIINYPIMYKQGDNDFYLDHNFAKEYSIAGTPFVDGNCDPKKENSHLIIYAHHMRNGSMFAQLEKYKEKEFYDKNKTITVYIENKKYTYEVFGANAISAIDDYELYDFSRLETEEGYKKYIEEIKEKVAYDTENEPQENEPLLLLSTCDYTKKEGRMIVIAKRIS